MPQLILEAHAKVNWTLRVIGKRGDGFHEISTLMQRISLCDKLTISPSTELEVITEATIPPETNLVLRAARLLKESRNIDHGARIELVKRIPIAAGLGGGSSDAAATLNGLCKLWGIDISLPELMSLGASLGSDIPFFLGPGAAIVEGRGEVLRPVALTRPWHLVLVKPEFGISAGWAYGKVKHYSGASPASIQSLLDALQTGQGDRLRALMVNDLEPSVLEHYREVVEIKERLHAMGAEVSMLSGSGSTVFGVFSSEAHARAAQRGFGEYWCVCATTLPA